MGLEGIRGFWTHLGAWFSAWHRAGLPDVSERQKWALPSGRYGNEKLEEEIPALVWIKDPYPVQDTVTETDGLGVRLLAEGHTPEEPGALVLKRGLLEHCSLFQST